MAETTHLAEVSNAAETNDTTTDDGTTTDAKDGYVYDGENAVRTPLVEQYEGLRQVHNVVGILTQKFDDIDALQDYYDALGNRLFEGDDYLADRMGDSAQTTTVTREAFGNGDIVTSFELNDAEPLSEQEQADIGGWAEDVDRAPKLDMADFRILVAPESGERLKIAPTNGSELETAISLLDEFEDSPQGAVAEDKIDVTHSLDLSDVADAEAVRRVIEDASDDVQAKVQAGNNYAADVQELLEAAGKTDVSKNSIYKAAGEWRDTSGDSEDGDDGDTAKLADMDDGGNGHTEEYVTKEEFEELDGKMDKILTALQG